ncbi:MAG: hypothetical protein MI799_10980 [Desulfobacterales bacterium]|nr:hypothetical protein [Desulfobacterales bacterium]
MGLKGYLVRTVNPLGEETVNTYDAQFRLTDITDNLGHVTHTCWNGRNNTSWKS